MTMRHQCLLCGGSCDGVHVNLLNPDEKAQIKRLGKRLKVRRPVLNNALRQEHGRCVFLQPDNKCIIHSRLGVEAKPMVCHQYPLIGVQVNGERRWGIDPGCYATFETWRSGPSLEPPPSAFGLVRQLDDETKRLETMVLHLLRQPDMSMAKLVHGLTNTKLDEFCGSIKSRLGDFPLAEILGRPVSGKLLGRILEPLVHLLQSTNPLPTVLTLDPLLDAFALHATTNMIRLVLAPHLPPPHVALLMCMGTTMAAAIHDDPAQSGRLLSAWSRVVRLPVRRPHR
ncbi:MAG: YkgJ family cysteine cluster protein [Proteobacteria bacterium]|jgi:Fe-S-cluster containining protein|nr:YkgJ family cysteine cluster protein [Pseudomonadota bacterium]